MSLPSHSSLSFLASLLAVAVTACSAAQPQLAAAVTSQGLFASYAKSMSQIDSAVWRAVPLAGLYQSELASSTDDAFAVPDLGVSWNLVHARLSAHQSRVAELSRLYPTLGALQDAGLLAQPAVPLSFSAFQDYLRGLDAKGAALELVTTMVAQPSTKLPSSIIIPIGNRGAKCLINRRYGKTLQTYTGPQGQFQLQVRTGADGTVDKIEVPIAQPSGSPILDRRFIYKAGQEYNQLNPSLPPGLTEPLDGEIMDGNILANLAQQATEQLWNGEEFDDCSAG